MRAEVKSTADVNATAHVVHVWDANSLTLAGVVYGIIVTVIGVVVATHGKIPTIIYAVLAIAGLAAGIRFPQRVITMMRRLLKLGQS